MKNFSNCKICLTNSELLLWAVAWPQRRYTRYSRKKYKMIKIITLLFLIILFSSNIRAQIFHNTIFKAGYVSSNVSHSFDNETVENFAESIGGIFVCISREITLSDLFSLRPNIAYNQKGFNEKWSQTNESGIVKEGLSKTKLDYLSLIFLVTIKYDNRVITPYISVGPRLEFLLSEENGMIDLTTGTIKSFWSDEFSKWSYGATILVGIDYKINDNLKLVIEGSYNPDISNLMRDGALGEFIKMRNNTFDFGIGIKL
jgi:opacity protein-like surface antigen